MTLTVRQSSVTGAVTKGSALTYSEVDANWAGLSDGSNWASTVNYSGTLNWTISGGPTFTIARSSVTFNGTPDYISTLGHNVSANGATIPDTTLSSVGMFLESDYNDGTTHYIEYHIDIAAPGGSYKRPIFSAMARSGGNSGLVTETYLLADIVISFYGPRAQFQAAASATTGVQVDYISLDTGGKTWSIYSTGSGAGLGAGHMLFYNGTNSRYGLILDKSGSVILGDLAALATNATDGFAYLPTCAGTPTGTPTSRTGKVAWVYDTTNNIIYIYNGAWKKTVALT